MLEDTKDTTSAFVLNGYWAGCKNTNPFKINYRSNLVCNTKLILRNSKNNFTSMIHYPQHTDTSVYLNINQYYFYHILTQSLKKKKVLYLL